MRKCGIIDMGSNTVRLSVYSVEDDNIQLLMNRKVMAGLASYVKKGCLTRPGIQMACVTLESYKTLLKNLDIDEYYAFATASLRNIDNTDEAVNEISTRTGVHVDVISGEDEGRLSLKGAIANTTCTDGLLIDLGGGSTEIVPFENREAVSLYSLHAGSLTLYKKFVENIFPTKQERRSIRECYEALIEENEIIIPQVSAICGVGGSVRAIAKLLDYAEGREKASSSFTAEELDLLYKHIKGGGREANELILHATPDRLHTIIPGMIAVRVIMKKAACRKIIVSRTGVREGYLYSRVLGRQA